MLVEFKNKKTVPFGDLKPGDTFKDEDGFVWLKFKYKSYKTSDIEEKCGLAGCLQNGAYSFWGDDCEVIPVKAKVVIE